MTQEHSPTPWTMKQAPKPVDDAYDFAISSDNAPVLAEVFGRCAKGSFINAEANAALIVKAVNSHDDLVKALERAKVELAALVAKPDVHGISVDDWPLPSSADRHCVNDAYGLICAALLKAKAVSA